MITREFSSTLSIIRIKWDKGKQETKNLNPSSKLRLINFFICLKKDLFLKRCMHPIRSVPIILKLFMPGLQ